MMLWPVSRPAPSRIVVAQLKFQIRYPSGAPVAFCSSVWTATTLGNCQCHCRILLLVLLHTLARLAMNFYGATFTSASAKRQGIGGIAIRIL